MTYDEALKEISSRLIFGSKLGLGRMEEILKLLGNPEKKLRLIHVAGTNGKGTTCAYMASALTESGCRTGLYTSPYVVDFRERFRIDGEMISKAELIKEVELLSPLANSLKEPLTEFEYITALALHWFFEKGCDIVVLEVGLGGRFDATNVIEAPEMAVITSISLDHTGILGDTVEKIAFEKGGIIKPGGRVTLYPQEYPQATEVIEALCKERASTLFKVDSQNSRILEESLMGTLVRYENLTLHLPFSGRHQVLNAATALCALNNLEHFSLPPEAVYRGFQKAKMPARMEILSETPLVLLDGGHNPGCANALKDLIERQLKGRKITAIMGMMSDKDSRNYLRAVAPLFSSIVTASPDNPRSMSAEALAEAAREFCPRCQSASSMEEAVKLGHQEREDVLLVCGSLYLAGEIRNLLKN